MKQNAEEHDKSHSVLWAGVWHGIAFYCMLVAILVDQGIDAVFFVDMLLQFFTTLAFKLGQVGLQVLNRQILHAFEAQDVSQDHTKGHGMGDEFEAHPSLGRHMRGYTETVWT